MSRRDLGRLAATAAAGALVTTAVPETAAGHGADSPPAPEPDTDPRLAALEQTLGRSLAPEQREAVLRRIRSRAEGWARARQDHPIPDQTEPAFVFRPAPQKGRQGRG